jgi:hypothetical protein
VTSEVFDVYLEPLVEEFLLLWEGVPAYDMTKDLGDKTFQLQRVLMWTIHDFPGYGTVGEFAHQGYAACPWYGPDPGAEHSIDLEKQTYSGMRRWLLENHKYRSPGMREYFNGKVDNRQQPRAVSVNEQLQHAAYYEVWNSVVYCDVTERNRVAMSRHRHNVASCHYDGSQSCCYSGVN